MVAATAFIIILVLVIAWLVYRDTELQTQATGYAKSARKMVGMGPAEVPAPVAPVAPAAPATPSIPEKKEGFCPKLMQKYGFCDAGESMSSTRGTVYGRPVNSSRLRYEGFDARPSVSVGTLWDGYMNASVLPGI